MNSASLPLLYLPVPRPEGFARWTAKSCEVGKMLFGGDKPDD
jgi:hypothetical protein